MVNVYNSKIKLLGILNFDLLNAPTRFTSPPNKILLKKIEAVFLSKTVTVETKKHTSLKNQYIHTTAQNLKWLFYWTMVKGRLLIIILYYKKKTALEYLHYILFLLLSN